MSNRRSTAEVLADMQYPEQRALYVLDRVDGIIRQMGEMLEHAGPEARALMFERHPRAEYYWHLYDAMPPKRRRT